MDATVLKNLARSTHPRSRFLPPSNAVFILVNTAMEKVVHTFCNTRQLLLNWSSCSSFIHPCFCTHPENFSSSTYRKKCLMGRVSSQSLQLSSSPGQTVDLTAWPRRQLWKPISLRSFCHIDCQNWSKIVAVAARQSPKTDPRIMYIIWVQARFSHPINKKNGKT